MSCNNSPTKGVGAGTESQAETRYEWTKTGCPSTAFVEAVADATGRDPTDMPPLYEYVDADALNEVVARSTDRPGSITVTITYDDVTGRLGSDGELTVLTDGESQ